MKSKQCEEKNLPDLKKAVINLYRQLDGGKLKSDSIRTLRKLGLEVDLPRKSAWFNLARGEWSRKATGSTLLLLVIPPLAAQLIPTVAAQRPQVLQDACSGTYQECASAFAPVGCCGFDTGPILNFPDLGTYLEFGFTNLRKNAIADALITPIGIMPEYNSTLGAYSEIKFFGVDATQSKTSGELYNLYGPGQGYINSEISGNSYNRTDYLVYNPSTTQNVNITSSSIVSESLTPSYLSLLPGSEILLFTVMNYDNTFGVGSAILRPVNGTASLLWQGLISNGTASGRVIPSDLSTVPLEDIPEPSTAIVRRNNTYGEYVDSFYSGYVEGPNGQSITIQQFAEDNNLIPSGMIPCLQQPGSDPLSCSEFLPTEGYRYAVLKYFLATEYNGLYTVTQNVVNGPVVENTIYRQPNSTAIQKLTWSYRWNPALEKPITTDTTELGSILPLLSNLTVGTVGKFAVFHLPGNATDAVGLLVSGSLVKHLAILGQQIVAAAPPSNSSSSDSSSSVLGPAIGGAVGGVTALCAAGTVGVAAAIIGVKCHQKHKREKAFEKPEEDLEMNSRSSTSSPPLPLSSNNFKAVKEGLSIARMKITGTLYGHPYDLCFTLTQPEAKDIYYQHGLKIPFPDDKDQMEYRLGEGSFGQVFLVKKDNEWAAGKLITGGNLVTACLKEGETQAIVGKDENILPLLEYLHYTPTRENKHVIKQLLQNAFGTHKIRGQNMAKQDLLLQITPLISFGSGETFQTLLARLDNFELKDKLITHFAISLLTALDNMHKRNYSHLDVKLSNTLVNNDGLVVLSDFGCAVLKDVMQGGMGDHVNYAPERYAFVRYCLQLKPDSREKFPEIVSQFSGKGVDIWAAGVSLLQAFMNKYPFGPERGLDMARKRDTAYLERYLDKAYMEIDKECKKIGREWTIFPVVKQMLAINPKNRLKSYQARKELLNLKPDASGEELFEQFREELARLDGNGASWDQEHADKSALLVYNVVASPLSKEKKGQQTYYGKELYPIYRELNKLNKKKGDDMRYTVDEPSTSHYDEVEMTPYPDVDSDTEQQDSDDDNRTGYDGGKIRLNPEDNDNYPPTGYDGGKILFNPEEKDNLRPLEDTQQLKINSKRGIPIASYHTEKVAFNP